MPRSLLLLSGLLVACDREPPRVTVPLADTPVVLGSAATTFRVVPPAPADNDVVGVCLSYGAEYELRDDWTLAKPGGVPVRLAAHATLEAGGRLALTELSYTGALCLHPAAALRRGDSVRDVSISASAPVEAKRVTWISTSK